MELYGRDLRYAIVAMLLGAPGPLDIDEILRRIDAAGDVVAADYPRKVVADALGHEVLRGRLVRVGRGTYGLGKIPRTTAWRIGRWRRYALQREEELAAILRAGQARLLAARRPPTNATQTAIDADEDEDEDKDELST